MMASRFMQTMRPNGASPAALAAAYYYGHTSTPGYILYAFQSDPLSDPPGDPALKWQDSRLQMCQEKSRGENLDPVHSQVQYTLGRCSSRFRSRQGCLTMYMPGIPEEDQSWMEPGHARDKTSAVHIDSGRVEKTSCLKCMFGAGMEGSVLIHAEVEG